MIFEEALKIILKNTPVLSMEKINLENSIGRVLGETLYASMPLPPFNKSAVDGYAVRAADTAGGAVTLKCVGVIQAGAGFKGNVAPGECVKIMTGAAVPPQTDSVVMVEDTRTVDSRHVKLLSAVEKNENIRLCGEDLKKGNRILSKGTVLDASHISLIASMGRAKIKAVKMPVVAVINTGGELIPPGTKIQDNKIYNSNGPLLTSLLNQEGFSSRSLGIVKDRVPELKAAMKKGLGSDVLLVSGGVSVGDYDFVPTVLKELGVKEIFHKLKIKPGKPLYFGMKKRTLVFGIPGNPIPNFVVYWLFIHPALRKMTGYSESAPRFLIGILTKDFKTKGDRQNFVLITIKMKNGQYHIQPVNSHGSADLQSLAQADGFMKLDIGQENFKKNQGIPFITWKTIA